MMFLFLEEVSERHAVLAWLFGLVLGLAFVLSQVRTKERSKLQNFNFRRKKWPLLLNLDLDQI